MQQLQIENSKSGADTFSSAIKSAVNYHRWILDEFRPYIGGRILEVGLGHGNYRPLLPQDATYFGIDIDERCIEQAKASYPGDSFELWDISDSSKVQSFAKRKIDTVICINVLEHILPHKPAFRNLVETLEPGGHLLLFVPAFQALYTSLDELAGHHRRYHLADLRELTPPNCKIIVNKYFNPIGGLGWWVNGFFKHKSLNDNAVNGQIEVFDKYVLPISRSIDPLVNKVFGQSLLAVVEKV
ncbi:MAG: hypothetical protein C0507_12640 [Cyanobacteria bacterium PR.3.49]|jgi:SAM-dependent methyltransferase|nr:hypothetical protein [Cyanobacteria bacterium PR.3.49]